jgi:hypothetical protein
MQLAEKLDWKGLIYIAVTGMLVCSIQCTTVQLCTSTMYNCAAVYKYEGRLINNAHSEISRKRDHVFKQTEVGSKVQYFSYKLMYLFYDIVALSFNTFFPT